MPIFVQHKEFRRREGDAVWVCFVGSAAHVTTAAAIANRRDSNRQQSVLEFDRSYYVAEIR